MITRAEWINIYSYRLSLAPIQSARAFFFSFFLKWQCITPSHVNALWFFSLMKLLGFVRTAYAKQHDCFNQIQWNAFPFMNLNIWITIVKSNSTSFWSLLWQNLVWISSIYFLPIDFWALHFVRISFESVIVFFFFNRKDDATCFWPNTKLTHQPQLQTKVHVSRFSLEWCQRMPKTAYG